MLPLLDLVRWRSRASGLRRCQCPYERAASHHYLYMQIVGRFAVSTLEFLIQRVEKREVIAFPLEHLGKPPLVQKG